MAALIGAYGSGSTSFVAAVTTGGLAPASGDAMFIVMESSDSSTAAGTPTTPTGWTKLYEESQGAGATNVTTLTIFGKLAGASETDVTVSGVGNHCGGFMVVVKGHTMSAITQTVVGTGAGGTATKLAPGTVPAVAVTANSFVLAVIANTYDIASWRAYRDLANTTLNDFMWLGESSTSSGAGGGIGVLSGRAPGTTSGSTTFKTWRDMTWRAVHIAVPASAVSTIYSQPNFRFRSDDSQTLNANAGWAAALNTNVTINTGQKFRLRVEVEGNASGGSQTYKLQVRRNGGPWYDTPIWTFTTTEETPDATYFANIALSAQFADGDATTNVLAGSGATFTAGTGNEDNTLSAVTLTSSHTEYEW